MYMFEPEIPASPPTQNTELDFNSPDVVTVLESFCVCRVCESRCYQPKTLNCLHSFCYECIRRLCNDDLNCPVCKVSSKSVNQSVEINEILNNLKPSKLFDERLDQFKQHKRIPCLVHPEYICDFYFKDFSGLACEKCRDSGLDVSSQLTDQIAIQIKNNQSQSLKEIISETENQLASIQESLAYHENEMETKNKETIAGISKYFSDLKRTIMSYLTVQEKNVLDQLKSLTTTELTAVEENVKLCSSLSYSLREKNSRLSRSLEYNSTEIKDTFQSILAMDIFKCHAQEYALKANDISSSMENETEFRFIINTELEDMLTENSLIKIESLNSQTRAFSDRTNHGANQSCNVDDDETQTDLSCTVVTNVAEISQGSSDPQLSGSNSTFSDNDAVVPHTEFNTSTRHSGQFSISRSDHGSNSEPEVPPPPYPGPPSNVNRPLRGFIRRCSFGRTTMGENKTLETNIDSLTDERTQSVPTQFYSQADIDGPVFDLKNNSHTFSVAYTSDNSPPEIAEVEWLTPTALAILDKKNKSLKIVSDGGALLSCHVLPNQAYNFTLVDDDNGMLSIVASHSGKFIKYCIDVSPMCPNNSLKTIRFKAEVIRTRNFYRCVTFYAKRRKFVALSATSVDILDDTGRVEYSVAQLKRIRFYVAEFSDPSSLFSIRVNNNGIIALSNTMHVIFISMDGTQTGVFHGDNMTINGIGIYEPKNLFYIAMSNENRGQIACVDYHGKRLYTMNFKRRSGADPKVLSFSPYADMKLAVGHGNGCMSIHFLSNTSV